MNRWNLWVLDLEMSCSGLVVTSIWVNIGSGNGLLPDGTKPLPEPVLTNHSWGLVAIHQRAILQEMRKISILDMSLEITH